MSEDEFGTESIAPPTTKEKLTNQQILLGERQDPLDVIKNYSAEQWERFVLEWLEALSGRYSEIRRASGSRDKGRDVIAYVDSVNSGGPWDNYQCKHYDHPLYPSDVWKELAKLCYYTFEKKYTVPRAYYFAAPWGIGPEALLLFENPKTLQAELISHWEKGDLFKVGKKEIVLKGELRQHVEEFDFAVIKDLPPTKIIEEHRHTRFHAARFGGGLVRLPPDHADVPNDVADIESRFVEQLLQAYGDHIAQPILAPAELAAHPKLKRHFERQRRDFYLAELLRNFTRDNIPEDGCFERLQDAIFDGVIDVAEGEYKDGFERLKKTLEMARVLQIDSHPLRECLEGYHRSGVCHQLANGDRLQWVP